VGNGLSLLGVKWLECEIGHSVPAGAKVKKCVDLYRYALTQG